MGNDIETGEVLDPALAEGLERNKDRLPNRELTGRERWLLRTGKMLDGQGNGSWPSFDELPKDVVDKYRAKGVAARRQNAADKKLMERAAYLEAHKQHASTILGGRVVLVEGLLAELIDPETGQPDTKRLTEKRLQLLQTMLNDFDKGMGMAPQAKAEGGSLQVNVTHTVSKILDRLGEG